MEFLSHSESWKVKQLTITMFEFKLWYFFVSSCVDPKSYLFSVACTWKLFGNFGFIEFEYKWVPVFSLPTKITKWWIETSETTSSINWYPCSENQSWYGFHTMDKIVSQWIRFYFNLVKIAIFFIIISFVVGTFVQRLLLGFTGADNQVISLPFSPNVEHLRERFERKYGYRGERLIEQLGNGHFRYSSGYLPCKSCRHWLFQHDWQYFLRKYSSK